MLLDFKTDNQGSSVAGTGIDQFSRSASRSPLLISNKHLIFAVLQKNIKIRLLVFYQIFNKNKG